MVTFWPTREPPSPRPCWSAAKNFVRSTEESRNPITGIFGCCALAASGHPAAAPPSRVMNSRRLICAHLAEDHTLPHGPRKSRVVHHSKFGGQCRSWVKTGKAQIEHVFSGLPPTTDI